MDPGHRALAVHVDGELDRTLIFRLTIKKARVAVPEARSHASHDLSRVGDRGSSKGSMVFVILRCSLGQYRSSTRRFGTPRWHRVLWAYRTVRTGPAVLRSGTDAGVPTRRCGGDGSMLCHCTGAALRWPQAAGKATASAQVHRRAKARNTAAFLRIERLSGRRLVPSLLQARTMLLARSTSKLIPRKARNVAPSAQRPALQLRRAEGTTLQLDASLDNQWRRLAATSSEGATCRKNASGPFASCKRLFDSTMASDHSQPTPACDPAVLPPLAQLRPTSRSAGRRLPAGKRFNAPMAA